MGCVFRFFFLTTELDSNTHTCQAGSLLPTSTRHVLQVHHLRIGRDGVRGLLLPEAGAEQAGTPTERRQLKKSLKA